MPSKAFGEPLDGPWTISVCVDCGRTSLDMSHGKCRCPVCWTLVEVMPRAEYERQREDLNSYRRQAINAEAEVERLRQEWTEQQETLVRLDAQIANRGAEVERLREERDHLDRAQRDAVTKLLAERRQAAFLFGALGHSGEHERCDPCDFVRKAML